MARYKPYVQEQLFFEAIDPVAFKKNDPLLRVIDEFVQENLETEAFSKNVKNDELGAAALDPKLVCKVLFYAIANGIRSYRNIEDRLNWDPAFMILSARKVFDYTTLCRFISVHHEALEEFFTIMVYILIKQGYMTTDFFATDGTKIKASAGKDFTGTVDDFQRRSKKLEKRIAEILAKMGNDNPDPDDSRKLRELHHKKEKIDKFLNEVRNDPNRIKSKEKVNLTDPDARIMKDKDTTYPGYNLQLIVESNHFIAANHAFTCTADQPHLQPMIQMLRDRLRDSLQKSVWAFDAGYYSPENILFLQRAALNAYIPEGQAEDGTKIFKNKTIGSKDCALQKLDDHVLLTCPGDQTIIGKLFERPSRPRGGYTFNANKTKCLSCPLMQQCYGKQKSKRFEVDKIMIESLEARQSMRTKVASDLGRQIRNKRFSTSEHVNGEIKDRMNLRQFYHRGTQKVKTISFLTAIGYNFRRLAAVS
jgi:transposase